MSPLYHETTMIRGHLLLCCYFLPAAVAKIFHGFNRYTTYESGSIGIIITAPHGGTLDPNFQVNGDIWPMRKNGCENKLGHCVWTHKCNKLSIKCSPKTLMDEFTKKIAGDIADEIQLLTGLRPHVVYSNLRRRKMDANREINQATFGIPDAVTAYNDYSNFIEMAKASITGPGLLFDIHGQTHQPPGGEWIELGYLLSHKNLDSGKLWKSLTSINHLGERICGLEPNMNNPCFKDLIRGTDRSLGHFMNIVGLRVVPSPQIPTPGDPRFYYTGGFTVQKHGSQNGGFIDGVQLELPRNLRVNWPNDKIALVNALMCFYVKNYNTELSLKEPLVCEKTIPTFEETEHAGFKEKAPFTYPPFEETEKAVLHSFKSQEKPRI